ncbi:MAG: flagellar protein FliS [Sphingomonas sp.]|nr:flagellar protein FliS [Sphingomonas sp.]
MSMYATTMGRDPEAVYRQIDIAGRTAEANPHQLVQLLYEELDRALRALAWATDHHNYAMRSEKATRAIAVLFALESGLDYERGGDVAKTLGRLYLGARRQIVDASLGQDSNPFLDVANSMTEIADAWRSVAGRA